MKKLLATLSIIIITLLIGYTIGRCTTIRQAELLNCTDTEYFINFNGEVHEYTF